MGRKLRFDDIDKFKEKINDYFEVMDKTNRPYTISGLAYYLGTNRMTLLNYKNKGDEFAEAIELAKCKIEAFVEEQLFINSRQASIIFNLKNNFQWKDQQDLSLNSSQNVLSELSTADIRGLLSTIKSEEEIIDIPEE